MRVTADVIEPTGLLVLDLDGTLDVDDLPEDISPLAAEDLEGSAAAIAGLGSVTDVRALAQGTANRVEITSDGAYRYIRGNGIPDLIDEARNEVDLFLRLCPAATVGVTGTKGKTTTAWLAAAALRQAGIKTALFGTIAHDTGDGASRPAGNGRWRSCSTTR